MYKDKIRVLNSRVDHFQIMMKKSYIQYWKVSIFVFSQENTVDKIIKYYGIKCLFF